MTQLNTYVTPKKAKFEMGCCDFWRLLKVNRNFVCNITIERKPRILFIRKSWFFIFLKRTLFVGTASMVSPTHANGSDIFYDFFGNFSKYDAHFFKKRRRKLSGGCGFQRKYALEMNLLQCLCKIVPINHAGIRH